MRRWLVIVAMLWASPVSAEPFAVHILSSTYTTHLFARYTGWPFVFNETPTIIDRTQSAPTPFRDALLIGPRLWTTADSDLFSVSAATDSHPDKITAVNGFGLTRASAQSVVQFSPDQDGLATLQLEATRFGNAGFTDGTLSVTDLTTGELVWTQTWLRGTTTIPFVSGSAVVVQDTWLLASHVYQLTVFTQNDSSNDDQSSSVRLQGLIRVPEPGTWLLVGLGLAVVTWRRHHEPYVSVPMSKLSLATFSPGELGAKRNPGQVVVGTGIAPL